jgi:putative Mn2+ efflux pump MntP
MTSNLVSEGHFLYEIGLFLFLSVLVIVDNFRASIGLGVLGLKDRLQRQIAIAFGIFESLALVLGYFFGTSFAMISIIGEWAELVAPLIIAGLGVYAMILALGKEARRHNNINRRWLLIVLPFSLALDNLAVGFGLGILGVQFLLYAMAIGAISVIVSLLGLKVGENVRRFLPSNTELLSGATLMIVAISFMVIDL